ncbi:MAG: hypothetical protein HWD83_08550 [Gammaproteobacteria bacterium]|nr:hypothetical protein [Gammaproteobacteria bacterium]
MYPINQLVLDSLACSSKRSARKILAAKLSSNPTGKTYNRVDDILEGRVRVNMIDRLAKALELEPRIISEAIAETEAIIREEQRIAYAKWLGPHIFVNTRGKVTQITFAALLHNYFRIIRLDRSIIEQPMETQLAVVKEKILEARKEKSDPLPIFGEIVGYIYRPALDQSYSFDKKGELVE